MNLFSILDRAAGKWPNAIAVVDHCQRMTYREIHVAAESLARELQQAGIHEGDKVGVVFPRGAADIVASFAAARLRAVVVQISPASKAAEVARLSEKLNFDALVYSPEYEPLIPRDEAALREVAGSEPFSACIQRAREGRTSAAEREQLLTLNAAAIGRSEERRVGKECRSSGSACHYR